jgi:O-antigen ligase
MSLIDKIIYYLFAALFTLTPLIVFHKTSELFEFNKIIFIYIVATLIFFFWLLKSFLLKKIIIKKTYLDKLIIFFLISQFISTIFSIDRHTSIFGFYGRFNGGLLSIIFYIGLYYALISNLNKEAVIKILKLSVLTSFLVVLIGLPGKINHDLLCYVFVGRLNNNCWTEQFKPAERMFSTLGQPNWLGAYLTVNFFLVLYFFLNKNKENKFSSFFYLIASPTIFTGILFSRSRSAILSLFVGYFVLIAFVLLFKKNFVKISTVFKKLGLLSIILLSLIIIFKTGINQIDRLINFNFANNKKVINSQTKQNVPILVTESFDLRKIVWKGAIELGKRYPLFGTGVETFGYAYYFARPKEHNLTSEWDYLYNKAHNEYLNYLATTGFIGLISYLFLIFSFLWYVFKQLFNDEKTILKLSLTASFVSILITNFFGFSTTTINLFFYLIPAMFFIINEKEIQKNKKDNYSYLNVNFNNFNYNQLLSLFVLVIITLFNVLYFISYWWADINYNQGQNYNAIGDHYSSATFFKKALSYKYEHVYQDKLSYSLASLAFLAAYQKEKDITDKYIKESKYYNEQSIAASPKNILYWRTRAKNYYLYYLINANPKELEEGIAALIYASKIAPTDAKIPYTIAVFYSLLQETDKNKKSELINKAFVSLNEAIDLKPNYRDAYLLKGQLLAKIGKKDEAKKTFFYILQNINPKDQEVIDELKKIN